MILEYFQLPSRINAQLSYSGMDHPDRAFNQYYFKNYPHQISYIYNSRGFRDAEWPNTKDELKKCIWCFGDSFTSGIGVPYHHIWPQVLQQQVGVRTINISLDGAPNDWIANRIVDVINEISPDCIVVQWSYLHRRFIQQNPELKDVTDHELGRLWFDDSASELDNIENWRGCLEKVSIADVNSTVIHSVVPNPCIGFDTNAIRNYWKTVKLSHWPAEFPASDQEVSAEIQQHLVKKNIWESFQLYWNSRKLVDKHNVIPLKYLDHGRDQHHYDIKTAEWFVDQLLDRSPLNINKGDTHAIN